MLKNVWIIILLNIFLYNFEKAKASGLKDLRTDSTLYKISARHLFSDQKKLDSFCLILTGKSILKGEITFKILAFDGRIIHKESFPSTDLLWDEGDVIPIKYKKDTITARMRRFFLKENFIYPAIKIIPVFDSDFSDKKIWQEIKTSKNAIGFIYTHGYEGTYAIAYSHSRRKTVVYYSSD